MISNTFEDGISFSLRTRIQSGKAQLQEVEGHIDEIPKKAQYRTSSW